MENEDLDLELDEATLAEYNRKKQALEEAGFECVDNVEGEEVWKKGDDTGEESWFIQASLIPALDKLYIHLCSTEMVKVPNQTFKVRYERSLDLGERDLDYVIQLAKMLFD